VGGHCRSGDDGRPAMRIFIDTAAVEEVKLWADHGVVHGVTTNATLLLRAEGSPEAICREIAALVAPRPVSWQVLSLEPSEMIEEGRELAERAANLVVKIPVISASGEPRTGVISALANEGIRVNATACLSFGQALCALNAGATYVSLLLGRINDSGSDGCHVIQGVRDLIDRSGFESTLLVGSIRQPADVEAAARAGAHAVTIPPAVLAKLIDHDLSRRTVDQFFTDAARLRASLQRALAP
jgi:transaldolase